MKLTSNSVRPGKRLAGKDLLLQGATVLCLALTMITPTMAQAPWQRSDSPSPAWSQGRRNSQEDANRQKNKNDWRNITIGAGAVGLYGLIKGNTTTALLGAAGAAYAADRYEKDRHSQSQQDNGWQDRRYYHQQNLGRYEADRRDSDQRDRDQRDRDQRDRDQRDRNRRDADRRDLDNHDNDRRDGNHRDENR